MVCCHHIWFVATIYGLLHHIWFTYLVSRDFPFVVRFQFSKWPSRCVCLRFPQLKKLLSSFCFISKNSKYFLYCFLPFSPTEKLFSALAVRFKSFPKCISTVQSAYLRGGSRGWPALRGTRSDFRKISITISIWVWPNFR